MYRPTLLDCDTYVETKLQKLRSKVKQKITKAQDNMHYCSENFHFLYNNFVEWLLRLNFVCEKIIRDFIFMFTKTNNRNPVEINGIGNLKNFLTHFFNKRNGNTVYVYYKVKTKRLSTRLLFGLRPRSPLPLLGLRPRSPFANACGLTSHADHCMLEPE